MRLQRILAIGLSSAVLTACGGHAGNVFPSTYRVDRMQSVQTHFTVVANTVLRSEPGRPVTPLTTISYIGAVHTIPASLKVPNGVTYDPDDGNLYVLDEDQNANKAVILRVTPSTGATLVFVTLPTWFANGITYVHANKTLYVTSQQSPSGYAPSIMAVSSTGAVSTLAGGTTNGTQNGTGASASFTDPTGIAYDTRNGSLYVADSDRIRRITTTGIVTTIATNIGSGFSQQWYGLTFDGFDGNLYLVDPIKYIVQRITTSGTVTTIAGQCFVSTNGCAELQREGHGTSALFAQPYGITANPVNGALYIADRDNNSIRKIDTSLNTTTLAGNGLAQDVDGAGLNAELDRPEAITFVPGSSLLYVLESNQAFVTTAALRSVTTTGTAPPPPNTKITLYDTVTPNSLPTSIDWHASTPAASYLWYTERTSRVARMTTSGISSEFTVPTGDTGYDLFDVALGADGTPWMDLETGANKLWHRTSTGAYASYVDGGTAFQQRPETLAYGPDGNVWFATINGQQQLLVGYVASGKVVSYTIPSVAPAFNTSIAFDSAGTIWVALGNPGGWPNSAGLVRISRTGTVMSRYLYPADYVTKGPDGNIWFTQQSGNGDLIGTVRPTTGVIATFPLYAFGPHGVTAITTGSDGALWFAESTAGAIGRITTGGAYTQYPVFAARSNPLDLTNGPDGNIWFVDSGAQKIGRLALH